MSGEKDFLEEAGLIGNAADGTPPPDDGEGLPDSEAAPEAPAMAGKVETSSPEKPEEPAAKTESENETARRLNELEAEYQRLKAENAGLDKRLKDTQAAFTRDRQKLKNLEERQGRKDELPGDEDWFGDREDSPAEAAAPADPDPDKPEVPQIPWKPEAEEIRREIGELKKAEALRAWEEAERPVLAELPDYDTVVNRILAEAINAGDEKSQFLMAEFRKRGATPKAAYEVGKLLMKLEGREAPAEEKAEAVPDRKDDRETGEQETEQPASTEIRPDDPDWNSAPPWNGDPEYSGRNPLDDLLEELNKG